MVTLIATTVLAAALANLQPSGLVASASLTAEDCSLNGQPSTLAGSNGCKCNPGWTGATCALLDRGRPASREAAAIAGPATRPARPGSTWGGNVLVDEATGEHHLFVADNHKAWR